MIIITFFSARRRFFLYLCALLLSTGLTATAKSRVYADSSRNAPKQDVGTILLSDVQIALSDAGAYFTAPLRFSTADWLIAAGTLGASAALMPADESLNSAMLRSHSQTADIFAEAGRLYGDLAIGGSIGAGLYVIGLAAQNEDVRVTGRLTLEALAYCGVVNLALKSLVGRSRPYTGNGAFTFRPVQFGTDETSFPSGHAVVAFAVSSVLAERIGNPWVGAGLYAVASLTALSRMYQTKHWASDVVLGGAIGAGAGLLVTYLERERAKKLSAGEQLFIYPTLTGVGLTYHFR